MTASTPGPRSSGCRESVGPAPAAAPRTCCCCAAAAAGRPAAPGTRHGLGEPEGAPCECERARAPDPRGAPGLCANSPFRGEGGGVSRARASECPVLAGEVCVCPRLPGPLAWVLGSPFPSLPPSPELPAQTPTTCAPEKPNSSCSAPRGGGRGRAKPQRGPPPPPASSSPPPPPPSDAASSGRVFGGQRPPQAEAPQRFL